MNRIRKRKKRALKVGITTIKQFLYKHPRLNLMQYIIRKKLLSAEACDEMLNMETNPLVVRYRHYGELNKGITIYYICYGANRRKAGYCVLLKTTLLHLAYADRMGFLPVVEWTKDTLYTEEKIINGKCNGFEYFMESPVALTVDEVLKSDLVVCAKYYDFFLNYDSNMQNDGLYEEKEHEIEIMSEMFKKHIKFNETGVKEILNPANELLSRGKCLGVHVRGTDFNKNFNGHPKAISVEKYISQVEEIFSTHSYQYIFLATDEVQTVKKFSEKFGEKLLYYDVLRSENGDSIHYGNSFMRENHKYYLGMEILKDVYTLGQCDGLVAGVSNVSIIARVIKQSTGLKYEDEIIINEGFNNNFHAFH